MLKATTARALAALLGAAVFGPAARAQSPDPPDVRSQMLVSTDWLQRHLADSGLVILHVGRDRRQYDSGHIPGARFVALDEVDFPDAAADLRPHVRLVHLDPAADDQGVFSAAASRRRNQQTEEKPKGPEGPDELDG